MDQIEFIPRDSSLENYQVVDIFINGFNLINIVSTEEQSLFPLLHVSAYPGLYEGLPPRLTLPPHQHFWGISSSDYQICEKRIAILESRQSGVPREWTISVEVLVDGEKVVWQNFRQEQLAINFDTIGPFEFELVAYKKALHRQS